MPTPLFIQATLHDGPNFGDILIPYVDALPLEPTSSRVLILDQLVGISLPGLYVYDNSQAWRYAMPIEAVSAIVVGGDQCDIYINVTQTYNLGPRTIVYRNGQLQTGHDVTPASAVYAVRTPNPASQGAVTSVNDLTGDVVLAAGSNVTVTDDGAGTITIASTGGGGTITSVGTGTTLIDSQTPQNTSLRSLVAGANVTISSDGTGGLVIASSAGAQSTTLQGDVIGTGTGTITTTLANSGVSPGTYRSVTVDAKGRVTAGTNPTTLAGFGITDALPLAGGSMTGDITMTTGKTVKGVPDPINQTDAANKNYVDAQLAAAANGVSWRAAVAAATAANLAALSGLLAIDGYTLQAGDRVLVKNQTDSTQNGVYDAAVGAWTRSADSNTGAELYHAAYLVVNGTANGLTQWANTNQTTPTVGTDGITFGQLRAAGNVYTAGAGLQLSGLQFSIAPTGVTAGTYAKVTVNTLGQVTGGSALAGADITAALGYTPYNGTTNPNGFIGALIASGDATGNTTVTGSSGNLSLTLSNTGVVAGTYTSVTVDAKGRVTTGGQISPSQITAALGYTPVNKAGDTMTGALNFAAPVGLASAATLNIGAAGSNLINVTGTTTITAFDSAPGAIRTLIFAAALMLTHNAAGIILPTGANITTAAGDIATFINTGGTTWRCVAYQRADGTPLKGGGGSPYTTVQIFNGSTTDLAAEFTNAVELARITGSAPTATTNFDFQLGAVQWLTTNTTVNWTLNFRFNSTTALNTALGNNMAITAALIVQNGASAFFPTAFQIDGSAVTPKWQNALTPSAGTVNGFDVYTFTIIKTTSGVFTVFGSQTPFQ